MVLGNFSTLMNFYWKQKSIRKLNCVAHSVMELKHFYTQFFRNLPPHYVPIYIFFVFIFNVSLTRLQFDVVVVVIVCCSSSGYA